jgi:hypothetical protein
VARINRKDIVEASAQLYGGPHDGEGWAITRRNLKHGAVSLLHYTPDGRPSVSTYEFKGHNEHGQHRLVYRPIHSFDDLKKWREERTRKPS